MVWPYHPNFHRHEHASGSEANQPEGGNHRSCPLSKVLLRMNRSMSRGGKLDRLPKRQQQGSRQGQARKRSVEEARRREEKSVRNFRSLLQADIPGTDIATAPTAYSCREGRIRLPVYDGRTLTASLTHSLSPAGSKSTTKNTYISSFCGRHFFL